MNLGNVQEVIFICGLQLKCHGNEAVGEVEIPAAQTEETFSLPVCQECLEALAEKNLVEEDPEQG